MTRAIPDLALWGSSNGQFFPRWTYHPVGKRDDLLSEAEETEDGYRRVDNITDAILADCQQSFGAEVSKDDIFSYI
jgi:predicted helicase